MLPSTPMPLKQCVANPKPVVGVKTANSGSLLSASVNIIDHFLCIFNSGHCSTVVSITGSVGVIVIEKTTQHSSFIVRFPASISQACKRKYARGLYRSIASIRNLDTVHGCKINKQCSDVLAVRYAICNNQNIQGVIND